MSLFDRIVTKRYFVFGFLILIFILNIVALRHKGLTYDEGAHYKYGMNILELNSDRFDDSKMPFSVLNAAPRKIWDAIDDWKGTDFLNFLRKMRTGRYVTIFFSLLVGFFIFKWTSEMYGDYASFFALLLYTFSPNILAHSRLITTDLYAAGMTVIALYLFRSFLNRGGKGRAFLSAFVLGLSQLAKYTCVYLYPIFLLIVLFISFGNLKTIIVNRQYAALGKQLRTFSKCCLLFLVVSILIINAGYLFNKSFTPFNEYNFKSKFFKSFQSQFPAMNRLPVPLPYPYVEGLDLVKYYDEPGNEPFNNYLFGRLRKGEGFKGYYFYAFLYKSPIATQIFLLWAALAYIRKRKSYDFFKNEIFLIVPILFFTVYFNFFYRVQFGIRFFIVAFPLLYIFCGSLFKNWRAFNPKLKASAAFLASYLIISVLSYTPHYLSYFNELVWDRKQAYKILADSNIDWGENNWYLEQYKKRHPDLIVSPDAPMPGTVIVPINQLTGLTADPAKYQWLRDHFEPADHIAYSYLIYHISQEQLKSLGLEKINR